MDDEVGSVPPPVVAVDMVVVVSVVAVARVLCLRVFSFFRRVLGCLCFYGDGLD